MPKRYLSAWPNNSNVTPDGLEPLRETLPTGIPVALRAYRTHIELAACCTSPHDVIKLGESLLNTRPYYILDVDHLLRPPRLVEALALYRVYVAHNRYWEAHEVLEEYWKESRGPRRMLLQGLIKAAAALAKAGEGRLGPARRIAAAAEALLGLDDACIAGEASRVYFYGEASLDACLERVIEKLGLKE